MGLVLLKNNDSTKTSNPIKCKISNNVFGTWEEKPKNGYMLLF